jgi:hypothetical protein
MSGAIHPLPQYAFMAWCLVKKHRITLPLPLPLPLPSLRHKQGLRKLRHETRAPACKTAVNWVTKTVWRLTRRKALERGGNKNTKLLSYTSSYRTDCESRFESGWTRVPTTFHSPLGLNYHPLEKANVTAGLLGENSSHLMTRVTKTMNVGCGQEFKLCFKL